MKSLTFPVRVYLFALVLRLIPVLLTRNLGIGLDDMFQYDMLARSLAGGNGFRWYARTDLDLLAQYVHIDFDQLNHYDPDRGVLTSFRAPLYPAFLAGVYLISGSGSSRFFHARLVQAIILGAPLASLTYFTARRLYPENVRAAKLSAIIVAIYPILLIYPLGLGTENLFFILVLLAFFFLIQSKDKKTFENYILAGSMLGLASLTRSVILLFAGFALVWLWFYVSRQGAIITFVSILVLLTPWVVRNTWLHGRFSGIESSMGYNLYLGYHPQGNGSFVFGPSLDLLTIMDDAEREQVGMRKALDFITSEPERFVPLVMKRLGFFFGLEKRVLMYFYSNNLVGSIPFPILISIFILIVMPFMVISISVIMGFTTLPHWKPEFMLVMLLFIGYLIPHVLILSEDRFHLTLIPFFSIFAGQFWTDGFRAIRDRWRSSTAGKSMTLVAIVLCLLLVMNWALEIHRDAPKLGALFGPNGNQTYFPY